MHHVPYYTMFITVHCIEHVSLFTDGRKTVPAAATSIKFPHSPGISLHWAPSCPQAARISAPLLFLMNAIMPFSSRYA